MKKIKLLSSSIIAILLLVVLQPVYAQDGSTFSQIDKKHNDIESLYARVYRILDRYPHVKYSYKFTDGLVSDVEIEGVPNEVDRLELESNLLRLEGLKSEIVNQKGSSGIYYETEKEPQPIKGYTEFYRDLHERLVYPAVARKNNIKGTVIAKFIVDHQGNVRDISTSTSIDTPFKVAINDMENEVEKAIQSTSGEWIPAKVGDVTVDQWVSLPVQFDLQDDFDEYYPGYAL